MSEPLAYLLTWTCYGTWLHGDDRGSVDQRHNQPHESFLPSDDARRNASAARMRFSPFQLDRLARQIVGRTIADHCALRGWSLHAVSVRTNHVHVVCTVRENSPEKALAEFKAWCTRRLREGGRCEANRLVWTKHGSTCYLWDERSVAAAVRYVKEMQGKTLGE